MFSNFWLTIYLTFLDCESQQQKHQGHPRTGSSSSLKETIVPEKWGKFLVNISSDICAQVRQEKEVMIFVGPWFFTSKSFIA